MIPSLFAPLPVWFWRLVPGNPILVRVVSGKSRRTRHLWLRFAYLGVLLFVVMIALIQLGTGGSLADYAKRASTTFLWASVAQLALMCLLAPVFTADAITQEKDAQTYSILLTTPLSNAQIVLGSLMSRLFFVVTLLISGLPIFFMTMIYGGVTTAQIVQSFVIAGATAVVTGSLAITISMIRVGTRRTILSFYGMIGTYLLAGYGLGHWPATWIAEAPRNVAGQQLSWLAPFNPFLALDVALNRVQAPEPALVAHYGGLTKYFAACPHTTYVVLCTMLSVLLILLSLFFVRRGAKEGEATWLSAIRAWFTRRAGGERYRSPRSVWRNPVAWREAATRASALSRGIFTYALIGGGLVGAITLLVYYGNGSLTTGGVRAWLSMIVIIEFATILLIATNTAATAMTKEREANTMDLLLCTPLSSRYIVWGKLRGLVSFAIPLIGVPVVTLLLFAIYDLIWGTKGQLPAVYIESAFELAGTMIIFTALACMIGLDRSLKSNKTVQAVMVSVGLVLLLCLVATAIWRAIVSGAGPFGALLAPFTPFTAIETITDPLLLFDQPSDLAGHAGQVRVLTFIGTALAVAAVAFIVGGMYKSMVRNFDMILRKQSAR